MITVEDGTIVAGAESYVTVAEADSYHLARGNAAWSAVTDEPVKEAALRNAVAFLDGRYFHQWKGVQTDPLHQELQWPRTGVKLVEHKTYDKVTATTIFDIENYGYLGTNVIPQKLKSAQCELALRAISGELAPDTEGALKRKKIDINEKEYFEGASPEKKEYRVVSMLVAQFIDTTSSDDVLRG